MPLMRPDIKLPKEVIDQARKEIGNALKAIERWLTVSPWLCGEAPTVADLSCYCEVGQCQDKFTGLFATNGIDFSAFPHICSWMERCEQLQGFETSHMML